MGLMDTGLPDEDDDDSALEAELAALTRGNAPARKKGGFMESSLVFMSCIHF